MHDYPHCKVYFLGRGYEVYYIHQKTRSIVKWRGSIFLRLYAISFDMPETAVDVFAMPGNKNDGVMIDIGKLIGNSYSVYNVSQCGPNIVGEAQDPNNEGEDFAVLFREKKLSPLYCKSIESRILFRRRYQ